MIRAGGLAAGRRGRAGVGDGSLSLQPAPDRLDDLLSRRHDPQHDPGTPIHDHRAVDQHFVLTVAAVDLFDRNTELPLESRRHPDGMDS